MRGGCGSKWCSKRSTPRARSSPPIPASPSTIWNRRCAPTGRSPTTTIRPRYRSYSVPNIGWRPRKRTPPISSRLSFPTLRICRLYLGMSKLDAETAEALRKAIPFTRLQAYSHVLDFFGGMFEIRGGKAVVPGGQRSAGGVGRTGRRVARPGRRLLRQAAGQGRRLAGQPLRCPGAHPRAGAGLPDRAGAHEALLHRRFADGSPAPDRPARCSAPIPT